MPVRPAQGREGIFRLQPAYLPHPRRRLLRFQGAKKRGGGTGASPPAGTTGSSSDALAFICSECDSSPSSLPAEIRQLAIRINLLKGKSMNTSKELLSSRGLRSSFGLLAWITAQSVMIALFQGSALAHIKCPIHTFWGSTEDTCMHIHTPEPSPSESGPFRSGPYPAQPQPNSFRMTDQYSWTQWRSFFIGEGQGLSGGKGRSATIVDCNKGLTLNSRNGSYIKHLRSLKQFSDNSRLSEAMNEGLISAMNEVCPSVW